MHKILIKYTKVDRMKFISHLELIRVIERALRRADIPLRFSQGFNPHPKISFASPLSVGVSSEGEYMTVEVNEKIDLGRFKDRLNSELPEGIKFIKCKYIDSKSKSLMSLVEYGTYIVKCNTKREYKKNEIEKILTNFLNRNEILFKKRGKRNKVKIINIKKLIKNMSVLSVEKKDIIFRITLSTGSRGNLKPDIVIEKLAENTELAIDLQKIRVHRLETFFFENKKGLVPLEKIK
jgi:radical SAM-linked protein